MFNLIGVNTTISLILSGGKESTTWRESYTEYRQLLKDKADESVREDKALQKAIDAQLSKTRNQLRLATRDILSIDEKLSITIFAYCAWSMFLPVVSCLKLWTDITHSIDIISITMIILGVVFLAIAIRAERVLLIDRRNGLWKSFTGSINSVAGSVKEAQTPRTIANLFDSIMWIACRLSVALASCMIFLLAFEFIFYALIGCLQNTPGITMDDTTSLTCFIASFLTTILICLVVFMLVSSLIVKALRKNFYREELLVVSSDEI